MLKNYNYMLTIITYPFMLLLEFLMLKGYLKSNIYLYLIIIMFIIFIPSFIMCLYHTSEDIFKSKRKWRIILLILFPLFYLPIYYTKYVSKEEKYLGIIICLLSVVLSYFTYQALYKKLGVWLHELYKDSVTLNEKYTYTPSNRLFSIDIASDFRCKNTDIGDYAISCDKIGDDSFIGVYSYDVTTYSEEEIEDILTFHITQSLDYVKDNGYTSEIREDSDIIKIYYHDMVIMITQRNYVIKDKNYSLIIVKEMPNTLEDIKEFRKMIETIKFLNYNEEVSS